MEDAKGAGKAEEDERTSQHQSLLPATQSSQINLHDIFESNDLHHP